MAVAELKGWLKLTSQFPFGVPNFVAIPVMLGKAL